MKKIWSEKDGVSPVIATILMVAITVVLAAVLYVMVMIRPPPEIQGTGNIEDIRVLNNSSAEITFGTFSGTDSPTDIKLILEDHLGGRITLTWPTIPDSDGFSMTTSNPSVSATYRDYVPIANEINPGDSVIVTGLVSGESFEVKMVTHQGSEIALIGETSFVTP